MVRTFGSSSDGDCGRTERSSMMVGMMESVVSCTGAYPAYFIRNSADLMSPFPADRACLRMMRVITSTFLFR